MPPHLPGRRLPAHQIALTGLLAIAVLTGLVAAPATATATGVAAQGTPTRIAATAAGTASARIAATATGVASARIAAAAAGTASAAAAASRGPVPTRVPRWDPSRLAHVGSSGQVIVVTAPSWSSTRGTLRAYERRADGTWDTVLAATPARLGYGGLVRAGQRRQGTGTTPAGTFALPTAFGRRPDPGSAMPYVRFDRDDAWPYDPDDPATYNVFQHEPRWRRWSPGMVEHLWGMGAQYDYAAVLDFNLPAQPYVLHANGLRTARVPADTRLGGGIFLHVTNGGSTAGCIAIPSGQMAGLLRWMNPASRPIIVIGPAGVIDRM